MDDPETKDQNVAMASVSPKRLLKGGTPRLIDEWQIAPKLWDAIRFEVDHRNELGQFVLTGSAVPPDTTEITHSGTGRFTWLTMRPMTLFESGDSTGEVSLGALFSDTSVDGESKTELSRLAFLICRGGWPQAGAMRDEIALEQAFDYFEGVVRSDINRADGIRKDPERVIRLMRSFARNQGSQIANTVIARDIGSNESGTLDEETVSLYIKALKRIFVIEDMTAWNPNLRSKTAIRTSDTRYFVDPSIAVAALGIGPEDLLMNCKDGYTMFTELVYIQTEIPSVGQALVRYFLEYLSGAVTEDYADPLGEGRITIVNKGEEFPADLEGEANESSDDETAVDENGLASEESEASEEPVTEDAEEETEQSTETNKSAEETLSSALALFLIQG